MNDNSTRRIILASTSPRRRELLASLRIPFDVMASEADENTPDDWSPDRIVESLALRKAEAVYGRLADASQAGIVLGSDTVVVLDSEVLGKPVDEEDAAGMLSRLQGREHLVYTGVACLDLLSGARLVRHSVTRVKMKALSPEAIRAYVKSGEPADKAGAYGIQGLGATIVERIDGDYFTVVGLPLSMLSDMLSEMGIEVLTDP
ncbi:MULTISPECIES: Maf family protein [Paenibacillus]|uniref:dTTP/UTP pyrophosphatase n=1 Tax=Paenibacillus campinasensis TaxID=66347 RepID=A0A268EG01_9BACL|nr:Maf family protein [Paenibacillus campinasensis]MUG67777.1 septum formation inhibitor Maf [Paenibacillus campinasensis]PAD72058.1 septum formation protein Maf [Paenibacillus campinasensis]